MSVKTDYDFIGFTYNGKHSVRDLKIYRTSASNRYETGMFPSIKDTTASVAGQIGQYYFDTKVETKAFNVSFAFDELTESDIRKLKQTFTGKDIHELIFDEEPYKAYSAKVGGSSTIKHLCFESNEQRIYKGEGTVQFTCYYPYARNRKTVPAAAEIDNEAIKVNFTRQGDVYVPDVEVISLDCGVIVYANQPIVINQPYYNNICCVSEIQIYYISNGMANIKKISDSGEAVEFTIKEDSADDDFALITKVVYILQPQAATTGIADTAELVLSDGLSYLTSNGEVISVQEATISYSTYASLTQSETQYSYTTKGCYENTANSGDGNIINHYSYVDFPNKFQWAAASGLGLHTRTNSNTGDLACPFKLSFKAPGGEISINIDGMTKPLIFTAPEDTITWDSSVGLVTTSDDEIIPTIGQSCFEMPVGGVFNPNILDAAQYVYNLIYY